MNREKLIWTGPLEAKDLKTWNGRKSAMHGRTLYEKLNVNFFGHNLGFFRPKIIFTLKRKQRVLVMLYFVFSQHECPQDFCGLLLEFPAAVLRGTRATAVY